jgi:hypothetical protein
MTGGELAGLGAAAKAGKAAMAEEPKMTDALVEAAKDTPGFKQAAILRGERAARRELAVSNILRPIYGLVGVRRSYFESRFAEDFTARTANIPEGDLRTPPGSVAGPALEGLGWGLEEQELKDMYLNLLANASDGRQNTAHPSFAHAIRQLSADEATLLQTILLAGTDLPMIRVQAHWTDRPGFSEVARHVLNLRGPDGAPIAYPQLQQWVENWARLGLIEIDYTEHHLPPPGGEDPYAWAEDWPIVAQLRDALKSVNPPRRIEPGKGLLRLTASGRQFASAVFSWPSPPEGALQT